jgi:hypothetical protein
VRLHAGVQRRALLGDGVQVVAVDALDLRAQVPHVHAGVGHDHVVHEVFELLVRLVHLSGLPVLLIALVLDRVLSGLLRFVVIGVVVAERVFEDLENETSKNRGGRNGPA